MTRSAFLLLGAVTAAPAAAATHAPGAVLDDAAAVDVTPDGFDAIAAFVPALVPSRIDLDTMSDEYEGGLGQCWLGGYAYSFSGGWVGISVQDVLLEPKDGYLDLVVVLLVWVNDGSDPFDLYTELECIGDTCNGYVEPFTATATTTVGLEVVPGADGVNVLDATVGDIGLTYDLTSDDINLDDCAIGTIEEILNFFGLSIYDIVLDLAAGELEGAIAEFGPEIETTLEDAFNQASIDQELDVNGIVVNLQLHPSDLDITTAGMRMMMGGSMSTEAAAECIAEYDPGGSLATPSDPPALGTAPSGIAPDYHAAILLSDDIGNQALYALWRGGLLCYEVTDDIGIEISTALLGMLAGDAFDELFPDSKPMVIVTRPVNPPTMNYATDHDVAVSIDDLGLEFYGELDHRQSLILGIGLDGDVGVDLALDSKTGLLEAALAFGGDALVPTVTANEFVPEASDEIEANFAGVFDTLLGTIIEGQLPDLSFALPSFEGIGLQDIAFASTGANGDWLGGYAWVGPVSYTGEGCSSDGGCSGGCGATGLPGGRLLLVLSPLGLAALRRRQ